MDKNKVFISYAREDSEIAQKLYDDLKKEGVELWFDKQDLMPGQEWRLDMQKAIRESTFFLAIISSKSMKKEGFTQKELKVALDVLDERPEGNMVFIIPVRVDDCPVDYRLQRYHWVDLFPSYSEGLNKLLEVIKRVQSKRTWDRR